MSWVLYLFNEGSVASLQARLDQLKHHKENGNKTNSREERSEDEEKGLPTKQLEGQISDLRENRSLKRRFNSLSNAHTRHHRDI